MSKNTAANEAREAEATYTKATQAELAKNYDVAFRLYIKSAELYLHLNRSAFGASEVQKSKWKAAANRAIERAEKIKAVADRQRTTGGEGSRVSPSSPAFPSPGTGSSSSGPSSGSGGSAEGGEIRLTPVLVDLFSPHEQFLVLKKGERVNGEVYPAWDEPIAQSTPGADGYHTVEELPPLSSEQRRQDPEWQRPQNSVIVSPRQLLPQEIMQHIVTDCSLCASITVCLEYRRRFKSHLLGGVLHLCPEHPPSCGRYYVRVLFNGTWRRIAIDDRLPHSKTTGTLLCMSTLPQSDDAFQHNSPQVIWPSLLEKAYMKLMGGYEFPGSISSSDLHALAGWIPEHIDMKSPDFEREKTWARMLQGFLSAQCLITVGTGPGRHSYQGVELLPEHCYPVIDITEADGGPTMTILDSCIQGKDRDEIHMSESRHLSISWTDVITTFDGAYLSWNPEMWSRSLTFHGIWKRRGQEESSANRLRLIFNDVAPGSAIWVLLTRHVTDTKRASDFISLRAELEDEVSPVTSPIAQPSLTEKGTFTNGIHVLAKVRISSSSGVLCITACYDGDACEVGYTVDAYAGQPSSILSWDKNISMAPYMEKVTGSFTAKNSGGNGTYPTFMLNPQYHLRIHPPQPKSGSPGSRMVSVLTPSRQKVATTVLLKTERSLPVNLSLAWSQGERIYVLAENELVATSGPYSHGLATIAQDLMPGDYSLVVSAFEPHHLGSFSLCINASAAFDLKPIAQEGAGMYQKVVRGAWTTATAGGGPSFDKYANNPIFLIESPTQFQLKLRLQLTEPSTTASLNITLYPAPDSSPSTTVEQHLQKKHVATSGPYDDAICGVATEQASLSAGKYWAVPSTYLPGAKVEFNLVVYTTVRDVVVEKVRY